MVIWYVNHNILDIQMYAWEVGTCNLNCIFILSDYF